MTWGTSRFATGPGIAYIAPATVALVLSDDPELTSTLWALVSIDAPLDEVLEGISAHGLRRLPTMAIARAEDAGSVRCGRAWRSDSCGVDLDW